MASSVLYRLKNQVYNSLCTRRDIQSFFVLEALCIILYSSFLHFGYSSPSMSVKIIASWKISWKLRRHLLTGLSNIAEFKFSTTFRSKTRLLISFRITDGSDFSRKHAWTFLYFFEGSSFWRKIFFSFSKIKILPQIRLYFALDIYCPKFCIALNSVRTARNNLFRRELQDTQK